MLYLKKSTISKEISRMFFYDINIPSHYGYICQERFFDNTYISRPHWHGFIELEYFIEGGGTQQCNGKTFPIKAGDVWLLSTYDSHQINLDKGTKNINISLDSEILHKNLQTKLSLTHPLHCTLNEVESRDFMSKVDILCYEQEHHELLSRVKSVSIINEILVDIIRKSSPDTLPIDNPIVRNMADYLQANYKETISLTELATVFSLTPNYCGYLFKKVMGITFNDYLNILRLKNACKSLLNSNLSIKEIAYESGFHSLEYFYTTFKKFYGVTPAKYRTLTSTQIAASKVSKFSFV